MQMDYSSISALVFNSVPPLLRFKIHSPIYSCKSIILPIIFNDTTGPTVLEYPILESGVLL